MMEHKDKRARRMVAVGVGCLGGLWLVCTAFFSVAAETEDFDHQGYKIYRSYEATPEIVIGADSGGRNLAHYYSLRQYPGSPPQIPHKVDSAFSGNETDCLSCHAKGGYAQEFGKFVPVTPHPENTLCFQCHAQAGTEKLFAATDWQSIAPPRLGGSALAGSPPTIPHPLQLRENCISCHTGPGAVVEIRVDHASRGNCRQCHVPLLQTEAVNEFKRNP